MNIKVFECVFTTNNQQPTTTWRNMTQSPQVYSGCLPQVDCSSMLWSEAGQEWSGMDVAIKKRCCDPRSAWSESVSECIFQQMACLWSVESVFLFLLLDIHFGSVSESLAEDWSNSASGHWSNCNGSWGGWWAEDSVQMLRGFACIGETFSNHNGDEFTGL